MELLILRHAEAEADAANDRKRQLTPGGREHMNRLGEALTKLDFLPGRVFTSPYERAEQSAQILLASSGSEAPMEFAPILKPGAATSMGIIDLITSRGGGESRVLVVGHQPDMGKFIASLTAPQGLHLQITPGTLVRVDVDASSGTWSGRIVWVLTPEILQKFGEA